VRNRWLLLIGMTLMASLCSACTVFPGLWISESDKPDHSYHIVHDDDKNAYQVRSGTGETAFQVEEITPDLIRHERLDSQISNPVFDAMKHITPDVVPQEYRFGPGDIVMVTVWDHPELTNPAGTSADKSTQGTVISADGMMFYPYVGELSVAGKTTAEVRALIASRLTKVVVNPQVDVRVISYRAYRVQVFGEVRNPGVVNLDATPKGVIEAITERGGLGDNASRRQIILIRQGTTYRLDFSRFLSGNSKAVDLALEPGDIIQVPDKSGDQVFLLGEVGKQQSVVIQQDGMTLTEALTTGGGLDKLRSDGAGVLVFRRPVQDGQPPRIFRLDLSSPQGLLLAGEFSLNARDVVYVKTTNFTKYNDIVSQMLPTISAIYQLDFIAKYNP